ncbi:MAG: HDIG domain-containing protein, partial [Syntrophorhabdaceae bacterium]|nr:HDIG domain-containing protein [Syntrophorhabdaceae bacterium]
MKKIYVRDIKDEGREINDFFIVRTKGVYTSKNNTKYMSLELKDKTGTIDAKVWDNVDVLVNLFDKNDIIRVKAKTKLYQNKPQLNVIDIERVEDEIPFSEVKEFFPEGEKDIEVLKDVYFSLIDEIENPHIQSIFHVLNSKTETLERFFLFPASINVHHMYVGGLLEHSISVTYMCKDVINFIGGDRDIIIAGSLLHDIGKTEEMEFKGGFKYSDRGRLLGHITLGVTMLERLIREINDFPSYLQDIPVSYTHLRAHET